MVQVVKLSSLSTGLNSIKKQITPNISQIIIILPTSFSTRFTLPSTFLTPIPLSPFSSWTFSHFYSFVSFSQANDSGLWLDLDALGHELTWGTAAAAEGQGLLQPLVHVQSNH